jgi:hypothetical protein
LARFQPVSENLIMAAEAIVAGRNGESNSKQSQQNKYLRRMQWRQAAQGTLT